MYRSLGLERDPFALDYDGALYLETRSRTPSRQKALEHIAAGGSLWVRGPLGSGRQAFIFDLAQRLTIAGRPAVVAWGPAPRTGWELVELLHRNLCAGVTPGQLIEACEEVYQKLLDGLWRGGSVVMFPAVAPLGPGAVQEARMLTQLEFMGRPAAQVVCCGEGDPPFEGMRVVELEPLTAEEIAAALRRRCLMSGGPDALSRQTLEGIAAQADGIGDAVWRGAEALRRAAFDRAGAKAAPKAETAAQSVLDKEAISEVGQLLSALTSRKSKR